jgi:hypothetical protein
VLDGLTVGALAGHLARSVFGVERFLDTPVESGDPVSPVTYYARLRGTTDPGSPLNTGVRERAFETAAGGPAALVDSVGACLGRLAARLPAEPADRRVAVPHRPGEELLLDGYLRTRCVELAVHVEDLAHGIGSSLEVPPRAVALAVELLVGAARERHGDPAVLRALARRERDEVDALRVL